MLHRIENLWGWGVRRTVPVSSPGSSYWYCNNDSSRQPIKHRHRHSSVVEFFSSFDLVKRENERQGERKSEREAERKTTRPIRITKENIVFLFLALSFLLLRSCLFTRSLSLSPTVDYLFHIRLRRASEREKRRNSWGVDQPSRISKKVRTSHF